jgi:hypothetical protein
MRLKMLKSLARRFAGTALLFSGVVGIGTSFVLLISSCIGYLPYSDRPGPGWWGRVHFPSWTEFATYIGLAPWFGYFCLIFGLGLFGLCLVLGVASTPRWLNRLLGGLIAAAAAGLAIMGAGWYLALAAIGPDAAIVLGLLYGVCLFPLFIESRLRPMPAWTRITVVCCVTALFSYWLVSPFLPHEPLPPVNYDLVRVTPGEKVVTSPSSVGLDIATDLAVMNLRGNVHGGIGGGGGGSSQNAPPIDMELIALEPITKEAKLVIPKTGHVIYVLKDGVWTAHPSIVHKDKRTLTLEPGTDSRFDGGRAKLSEQGNPQPFTWYPVIPNGQ